MRTHPSLYELIRRETTDPNPRQTSGAILKKAPPSATHAIFYADRQGRWTVLFMPCQGLETRAQAERSRAGGKPPVAICPLDYPRRP